MFALPVNKLDVKIDTFIKPHRSLCHTGK